MKSFVFWVFGVRSEGATSEDLSLWFRRFLLIELPKVHREAFREFLLGSPEVEGGCFGKSTKAQEKSNQ